MRQVEVEVDPAMREHPLPAVRKREPGSQEVTELELEIAAIRCNAEDPLHKTYEYWACTKIFRETQRATGNRSLLLRGGDEIISCSSARRIISGSDRCRTALPILRCSIALHDSRPSLEYETHGRGPGSAVNERRRFPETALVLVEPGFHAAHEPACRVDRLSQPKGELGVELSPRGSP